MTLLSRIQNLGSHLPIAGFKPALIESLRDYNRFRLFQDISAGLTVGMVALPLAMAFAIASGTTPEAGLYTAIIAGFLISLLGGCRVQIGGPAGAFVVIIYGIIAQYGMGGLMIATIGSGIALFLMGLFKLGKFVQFIPISIVVGFTNGIAVLIGLQQVKDFLGLHIQKMPAEFFAQIGALIEHLPTWNPWAVALALSSLVLLFAWPKRAGRADPGYKRIMSKIPPTIVVLFVATALTALFGLPVETIGSKFGGIPQALPSLTWPSFHIDDINQLYGPIVTLAILGSIESLLCARVADTMTDDRHNPNQELMAQGVANMVVPFFGGIPATGTIARTVTNIKSGAHSPIAGMVHALTLLVVILVAAPLANYLPLAALAAILMFVAWNMGNWREFARMRHQDLGHSVTFMMTFLLTVIFDLTVAVQMGLVFAVISFLVRMNRLTVIEPMTMPFNVPQEVEAWHVKGALFFGTVSKLEYVTDPNRLRDEKAADIVILDFEDLLHIDASAADLVSGLEARLRRYGHSLIIAGAQGSPLVELERTGIAQTLGPNLVPTMEFAYVRARQLVDEKREAKARGDVPTFVMPDPQH